MRERVNARIAEPDAHFQHKLFSCFQCNLPLTNITCVKNELRDFSITLYFEFDLRHVSATERYHVLKLIVKLIQRTNIDILK
jgi:hypothetical protein